MFLSKISFDFFNIKKKNKYKKLENSKDIFDKNIIFKYKNGTY